MDNDTCFVGFEDEVKHRRYFLVGGGRRRCLEHLRRDGNQSGKDVFYDFREYICFLTESIDHHPALNLVSRRYLPKCSNSFKDTNTPCIYFLNITTGQHGTEGRRQLWPTRREIMCYNIPQSMSKLSRDTSGQGRSKER